MSNTLSGKLILVIDDEPVFSSLLSGILANMGANILQAINGMTALEMLDQHPVDLIICDLEMPVMRGEKFVQQLRAQGCSLPVIVMTASEDVSEIAGMLRLGVQDVILKPLDDIPRLREILLECLYPSMFASKVKEDELLFDGWDSLIRHPEKAVQLLRQLQPPIRQVLAETRVNYRQLTPTEKPGLVFDIAALSDHQLGFYILDVTRAGDNGVMAALLLRVLFNELLRKKIADQHQPLPQITTILNDINQLLEDAGMQGQFPLLVGYYNRHLHNLLLIPAGLHSTLSFNGQHQVLETGIPPGTFRKIHASQHSFNLNACECNISGAGGRINLMLSDNDECSR
ncbi:two-component system response regulator RssB [Tatumella sp. JGM118]|uniref:Chemotaxis protein CheY n=1 Tax=Tatumella terrea TaxID=419007 RepID=A0ABW1VXG9_9GAMM|nr:two-component system response regulator RssB [Tatumella sp. JGM118]MBS0908368.1 two-component system response regulator RssB [Tatumella sp. JGM118]